MKHTLHILIAAVLSLCALCAHAQDTGLNTPYSRYGIGRLSQQAQSFNQGLAGLAYGMRDGRELNFKNPASYSDIDSLSFLFDMGVSLQNGNFDTGTQAVNAKNVTFDYVSMGFRINKGLGMSLGVMHLSDIGYKIGDTGDTFDYGITGQVTPTTTYSGAGGLHELYAGLAYAPIPQLSVGVNGGYAWGIIEHVANNGYSDSDANALYRTYAADIRTYKLDFGLQWDQRVAKHHKFTLGLVYGLGHGIPSKSEFYNQRVLSSSVQAGDTLTVDKAWSFPHTFGGGLTWTYKNSLRVGVDYDYQLWSQATQPTLVTSSNGGLSYVASSTGYRDCQRITAGVEFVPDPQGLSWGKRVRYRAGFSYADSYVNIDGHPGPKSYLGSVGIAFPIINILNNRTFVNAAFQIERVKPSWPGQITETYMRVCLGISFNERWFMKWKVE